uniref:Uncharacterized protein n=1 Tax=Hordeum vulgare subsp. vulgare TaxID=112509 RepID=A0A8I6X3F2_HORVV
MHRAWLTRSRVRALSISTPESLKMRRTRSGRVIVPQLDSVRSWVVYDRVSKEIYFSVISYMIVCLCT